MAVLKKNRETLLAEARAKHGELSGDGLKAALRERQYIPAVFGTRYLREVTDMSRAKANPDLEDLTPTALYILTREPLE